MFRKHAELGSVQLDYIGFFHFGGLDHGKDLSNAAFVEMIRRANLYEEVSYALYRLDDKPHQSWSRFLQMAKRNDDRSAIISCLMFNELSATPKHIIGAMGQEVRDGAVKGLEEHRGHYDPEYQEYINEAIAELKAIGYDPEGKMIVKCCDKDDDVQVRW